MQVEDVSSAFRPHVAHRIVKWVASLQKYLASKCVQFKGTSVHVNKPRDTSCDTHLWAERISRVCAMRPSRSVLLWANECSVIGWICQSEEERRVNSTVVFLCMCVSVEFNEGFCCCCESAADRNAVLTITGCFIAAWNKTASEHATVWEKKSTFFWRITPWSESGQF